MNDGHMALLSPLTVDENNLKRKYLDDDFAIMAAKLARSSEMNNNHLHSGGGGQTGGGIYSNSTSNILSALNGISNGSEMVN